MKKVYTRVGRINCWLGSAAHYYEFYWQRLRPHVPDAKLRNLPYDCVGEPIGNMTGLLILTGGTHALEWEKEW